MSYVQKISLGIESEAVLQYQQKAHGHFIQLFKSGQLPAFECVESISDLDALIPLAESLRKRFKTIVVLGTGGSSLGGKTLCQLMHPGLGILNNGPNILFMDNIDPSTFDLFFQTVDWHNTLFLSISKSGNTAETLSQTLIVIEKMKLAIGEGEIHHHLIVVTEEKDPPLSRIASRYKLTFFPHHPKIGGRFSVFPITGTLPALIAGVDVRGLRQGAASVLRGALESSVADPYVGAATLYELNKSQSVTMSVLMPYLDRLDSFCVWYRQIWAESLGKKGKGLTPIRALGTVDQHSQTQLYLDGPRDKFFTLIVGNNKGAGSSIETYDEDLLYLNRKTLGDLLDAEQKATLDTLLEKNCPLRVLEIDHLDAYSLGALLMHFMIETVAMAALLEIDAFDQPAVERGKVLTREYLAR